MGDCGRGYIEVKTLAWRTPGVAIIVSEKCQAKEKIEEQCRCVHGVRVSGLLGITGIE